MRAGGFDADVCRPDDAPTDRKLEDCFDLRRNRSCGRRSRNHGVRSAGPTRRRVEPVITSAAGSDAARIPMIRRPRLFFQHDPDPRVRDHTRFAAIARAESHGERRRTSGAGVPAASRFTKAWTRQRNAAHGPRRRCLGAHSPVVVRFSFDRGNNADIASPRLPRSRIRRNANVRSRRPADRHAACPDEG